MGAQRPMHSTLLLLPQAIKKKDLPQARHLEHPNPIPSRSPEHDAQCLLPTPAASLYPSHLTVFFRGSSSSRSLPLRIIIMILF